MDEFSALVVLVLFFLPTIVALRRDHHNRVPIALVNVLLGWTVLGWIVALVWAFTATSVPARQR